MQIVGIVGKELIEHEERIKPLALATTDTATQLNACAVGRGDRRNKTFESS